MPIDIPDGRVKDWEASIESRAAGWRHEHDEDEYNSAHIDHLKSMSDILKHHRARLNQMRADVKKPLGYA